MATYDPVYRVTVYDTDGVTVLAPAAGAPHSADFKVATAEGVAGFQPYLKAPKGRRGRLNLLTRRPDTGFLTFKTLDQRTTAGGSNLSRWITAFVGDANGQEQLLGKKVLVERSTDGPSGTFSDYFTGTVDRVESDGRLWFSFKVRDHSESLARKVFVGMAHSSAVGVISTPLFPLGMTEVYSGLRTVPVVTGVISTANVTGFGSTTTLTLDDGQFSKDLANQDGDVITKAFHDVLVRENIINAARLGARARVRVTITSGPSIGNTGHWFIELSNILSIFPQISYKDRVDGEGHHHLTKLAVTVLRDPYGIALTGDPNYLAIPADATTVSFDIVRDQEPTARLPLFLEAHPWQIVKDILEGYYGRLSEGTIQSGSFGDVTWSVPYNTSEMAALIADTTWGTFRAPILETVDDARKWMEDHIMVPFGGGYYYDPSGDFRPLDLRRPTSAAGAPTFNTNDLADGKAPKRTSQLKGAITRVDAAYYADREISRTEVKSNPDEYPDVPPSLVQSIKIPLIVLNFSRPDLPERTLKIDAIGHRAFLQDTDLVNDDLREVESALARQIEEWKGPYLAGVVQHSASIVVGASELTSLTYGQIVILDFDETPDPSSNLRGGNRLARVTEISPAGLGTSVGYVDLGENAVANVPTLGALVATSGAGAVSVDVPVTLNAQSEPVQVEYAFTTTAVGTRPAEGSDLWRFAQMVQTSQTLALRDLAAGLRVWVRGRTTPTDEGTLKLPSAWVFPTTTDKIDLTGITTPGAVTVGSITGTTALVAWTNTSTDFEVEVHLVQGGSSTRVDRLEAGSDEYLLEYLDNSTAYTVEIYYRDGGSGGISAVSSKAFSTTATDPTCPTISGVSVIVGRSV